MTKGHSLEHDLRLTINNPKYSDIVILCEDGKKLHGSRTILAARSEVFDRLLYNGMKESYEKEITLPEISSSGMEIILEYIYTGSIQEDSLTKDNIIEAFTAADYFQLPDLQKCIIKTVKNTLEKNYINYSPELLTKAMEMMPSEDNDPLLNLLVEEVAIMPLNTVEFGRLSVPALQYILTCTYEKEKPFATLEYEVFRYSAILIAKQVSYDAYTTLMERLPPLEQMKNSIQIDNNDKELITDHQKIAKELEPLIKLIDFKQIKGRILANIIEPLEIVSPKIFTNVYRHKVLLNDSDFNDNRGIPPPLRKFNESDCVWDESAYGSNLIIKDNGKVVQAKGNTNTHQNVRAKAICDEGIYEWDIIIEQHCSFVWAGVCSLENFDFDTFAGSQSTAWMLGSSGNCFNSGKTMSYCPVFIEDNSKITVHLDMNKKTCSFTINGTKYPEVSEWNDLPSKVYLFVSICYPGQIRIKSFRKFKFS